VTLEKNHNDVRDDRAARHGDKPAKRRHGLPHRSQLRNDGRRPVSEKNGLVKVHQLPVMDRQFFFL